MSEPLIVKNAESYDLDTREQLEAEVMVTVGNLVQYCDAHPVLFEKAKSWLDRQAAITERMASELHEKFCALCKQGTEGRIVELTAERKQYRDNMLAQSRRVTELTAERDELQEAIDAMGNGQFYAMYRKACEERDHFKDLVRKQSDSNH